MQLSMLLASVGFWLLVLVTLQVILRELARRPDEAIRPRLTTWVANSWWGVLFLLVLAMGALVPMIYFILLLALLVPIIARCVATRRADEAEALSDLVGMVATKDPGALPDAVQRFAAGRSPSMSLRCRDFAYRLRCGQLPEDAIRGSRVPLGADSAVAMRLGSAIDEEVHEIRQGDTDVVFPTGWAAWPVMSQLAYLGILLFLLLFFGVFLSRFIFPTIEVMFSEFGLEPPLPNWFNAFIQSLTRILGYASVIWLTLIGISSVTGSRLMLRITPWFGGWMRSRNRWRGLRALAGGVAMGRPLAEVLELAQRTSPSRWIRSRSRWAHRSVVAGQRIPVALRRAGWLTAAESSWVESAEANGNLAPALDWIATSVRRRHDLIWRLRIAWLAPLVLLLIGSLVATFAYLLIGSLAEMIHVMSEAD